MTRTLALIALASTLAAPAVAQVGSGTAAALAHFNAGEDTVGERVEILPNDFNATTASSRNNQSLWDAVMIVNNSADSQDGRIAQKGLTAVSNEPAYGADIFARLKAESYEDE